MINSISTNHSDSYEKQRAQTSDDARSSDFAALFSVPVAPRVDIAPEKRDKAETSSVNSDNVQKDDRPREQSVDGGKRDLGSPQKIEGLKIQSLVRPAGESKRDAPAETVSEQAPSTLPADRSILTGGVKGGFGLGAFSAKRAINEVLPGRGKFLGPTLAGSGVPVPGKDETGPVRPIPGCVVTDIGVTDIKEPKVFEIDMPRHRRGVVDGISVSDGPIRRATELSESKFSTPRLDVDIKTDLSVSMNVRPGTADKDADPIGQPVLTRSVTPKAETAAVTTRDDSAVETIKPVRPESSGHNSPQSDTRSQETGNTVKAAETASTQILENFAGLVSKTQSLADNSPQQINLRQILLDQIEPSIRQIAQRTSDGLKHQVLKMRLNPADLGALEITLDRGAGGKLNAHFQTDNENTRRILSESVNQLRASLESSGSQVGELKISYDSSTQNGGKRQQDQTQNFGQAEGQTAAATNRDGISQTEDDDQTRLVNLRA